MIHSKMTLISLSLDKNKLQAWDPVMSVILHLELALTDTDMHFI